jgi:phosphohistidine phosphatase
MDLYLIRHARAARLGENNVTEDADRPLTSDGEEQARQVAAGLRRKGVSLERVLTSPLVRARQTADLIVQGWGDGAPELKETELLAPGLRPRKLARYLAGTGGEGVALVGHQPDLGELAAWLIGSKKAQLDFAKGGVAHIHCETAPDKGAGTLVWLVPPEWFA